MERYNPKKLEQKWSKKWLEEKIYEPDLAVAQRPFYNLMMFPYLSAEGLHIGAVRTFSGVDIYGRFKRMQGHDVFEPIGLDGFGIHSENYALKIGKHPIQHAKDSEKNFYRQLSEIGNGFAWNEKLETYDPGYYKLTQWVFVQMFKHGLAYRKKAPVNWCPSCKTVLSDEQVIKKSKIKNQNAKLQSKIQNELYQEMISACERCDTPVVIKELEQWFFKITDYAERLLRNLEKLDWSERVKIAQKNWIGKTEGAEIVFSLKSSFNYVFLHGYKGSPDAVFWPWLQKQLEKQGAKVYAPQLPHTDEPNIEEQVNFVLKNYNFDANTIIVTHSLGGVVALKLLPCLRGKVARVVMVAPPIRTEFLDGKRRPPLERATDWKFNFAEARNGAGSFVVIRDIHDTVVPHSHPIEIARNLHAKLVEVAAPKSHFDCSEATSVLDEATLSIKVFTTRPDTLFGATYMVVAPEHPLITNFQFLIFNFQEVDDYIKKAKAKTEEERIAEGKEKTGIELKGIKAINPATKEEIPIWVADYVLGHVGTGAIMAVPAHDQRDFEFAEKFKLSILPVIRRSDMSTRSVLMGFDNIHSEELALLGIKEVWPADKNHKYIEIPENSLLAFEKLVREKTTPGFWNEYVAPEHVVFLFKDKNGSAERLELTPETDRKINRLSAEYNNQPEPRESTWNWLSVVPFYKDIFIHAEQGTVINSGQFNGMDSEKAKWEITKFVGGERKTQYRLRDWLVSRQRYWGPPIPMIFCENCKKSLENPKSDREDFNKGELENPGWTAVPEKDLPVKLPYIKNFRPTGTDKSPLATVERFYKVRCPKCKTWGRRETDVSDAFLDSSWYYLGYLGRENSKFEILNLKFRQRAKRWLPVHMYIGGAEHSVLHLMYARFVAMALHDFGTLHFEEPFTKFRAHGLILKDGAKMSKSRGNVVNPDEYIRAYGADAIRMYLAFLSPLTQDGDFRDDGIRGITRFLERAWRFVSEKSKLQIKIQNDRIERVLHKTIKKVTEDIESLQYNTAIAALMTLLNKFEESPELVSREHVLTFLKLLAPLAPFISEELYQQAFSVQRSAFRSIHKEPWPKYNPKLIQEETFELVVQINGKVRDKFEAPVDITEEEATRLTLERERVKSFLGTQKIKKVIYVPQRLINIVV